MAVDIGTDTALCDRNDLDAFSDALRQSRAQARRSGNRVIVCCALPLTAAPCDLRSLFAVTDAYDVRWYWSDPDTHRNWCAFGAETVQEYDSLQPVAQAAQALVDLNSSVARYGGALPRWLAGFGFDPAQPRDDRWRNWPNGLLLLPRFVVEQQQGLPTTVTICVQVEARTDTDELRAAVIAELNSALVRARARAARTPAPAAAPLPSSAAAPQRERAATATADSADQSASLAAWSDTAQSVVGDIRQGLYEKVVLARSERVSVQAFARLPEMLQDLEARYGDGVVFAVARGGQVFAGATPERLVQTRQGVVSIDCLAGTAPRGAAPEEDATFADELLASRKNREEHSFVLRGILGDIAGAVDAIHFPDEPALRKLANVQHLYTPVNGRLAPGMSVLDVVARLHPTPAVAGLPKQSALRIIREREHMDRGWYAGPLGWIDGAGNGLFVVTLRSALLDEHGADLFAGAGIVADSEPLAEWRETEWKMRPMRVALGQELIR